MTGNVLILSGPPAAGKTTVARILATDAPRPTVHLETDQFFRSIRTGFVLPYLPAAEPQNAAVLTAVTQTVATFSRADYDVIVEGIIGPWFLPHFHPLTDLRIDYVVLRPTLTATLARATTRTGAHLRDPGPITGLHNAFPQGPHTLDTTGEDPSQTAARIRTELASNRYRLPTPPASASASAPAE